MPLIQILFQQQVNRPEKEAFRSRCVSSPGRYYDLWYDCTNKQTSTAVPVRLINIVSRIKRKDIVGTFKRLFCLDQLYRKVSDFNCSDILLQQ